MTVRLTCLAAIVEGTGDERSEENGRAYRI